MNIFQAHFSLLWTQEHKSQESSTQLEHAAPDLELRGIAKALSLHVGYTQRIFEILQQLSQNEATISYRLDVLDDLLAHPELQFDLETLLARIDDFDRFARRGRLTESPLHQVMYRLGELANYVDFVRAMHTVFSPQKLLKSEALNQLKQRLGTIVCEDTFIQLEAALPDLLKRVSNIHSVTIGVNLNNDLLPIGATLLSINDFRFRGESSFLNKLFRGNSEKPESEGISQLHSVPSHQEVHTLDAIVIPDEVHKLSPLLEPLMKDLSDILNNVSKTIAATLRDYSKVEIGFLLHLRDELAFYLGAVKLIERMKASGMPMSRPEILPKESRLVQLEDVYNLNLALFYSENRVKDLSKLIITNNAAFDDSGRIYILTGPNQGGKTVFTKAIGLTQILFHAGLFVPAKSAKLSVVDGIFTHFAVAEKISQNAGRLGEEAKRLNEIFSQASRHSLILLNESLSSTSAGESLYLARDIVRAMRYLGARAIFATHLHELAEDCEAINAETEGDSAVASLVSLVKEGTDGECSYRIIPSAPLGKSYAHEIAEQYGISYEQLTAMLKAKKE